MHHLEIKHLKMVSTLADTQNMTKAASMLFISLSALSQQLKDIETKLEVSLFSRARKKMTLTPTGQKVLKTARQVIETLEDTELEIAKLVSGDTGELKVGTQCMFCYKWLPGVMEKFQGKFPNIEFEIGNSEDVFKELESLKFDLIITGAPVDDNRFSFLPLFEDQMVCIMPTDHALTAKPFLDFKDFDDASLIFNSDRGKTIFNRYGLVPVDTKPKKMMTVGQPQAIIEMVMSGFGLSLFPRWAVASLVKENKIAWHIAFLNDKDLSVSQKEFINIVRKMNF